MAPRQFLRRPDQRVPFGPGITGEVDPTGFGRGFGNRVQPDQVVRQGVRDMLARGVISFDEAINDIDARNIPPQLVQVPTHVTIKQFGVDGAELCILKNPFGRMSFSVSNFQFANNVLFSFDRPVDIGGGVGAGIPIGNYYQETNGAVSINDIWVFCNDAAQTYPFWILGYEGSLSIAGNKR